MGPVQPGGLLAPVVVDGYRFHGLDTDDLLAILVEEARSEYSIGDLAYITDLEIPTIEVMVGHNLGAGYVAVNDGMVSITEEGRKAYRKILAGLPTDAMPSPQRSRSWETPSEDSDYIDTGAAPTKRIQWHIAKFFADGNVETHYQDLGALLQSMGYRWGQVCRLNRWTGRGPSVLQVWVVTERREDADVITKFNFNKELEIVDQKKIKQRR